jgi:hypothetical protein
MLPRTVDAAALLPSYLHSAIRHRDDDLAPCLATPCLGLCRSAEISIYCGICYEVLTARKPGKEASIDVRAAFPHHEQGWLLWTGPIRTRSSALLFFLEDTIAGADKALPIQHLLPLDWAEATRDSISGGSGWLLRASRRGVPRSA